MYMHIKYNLCILILLTYLKSVEKDLLRKLNDHLVDLQ